MPRTENTECSLISPVRQAAPVAQPTGDRSAKTKAFEHDSGFTSSSSEDNRIPLVAKERTNVGGVIAMADVASIAEKKANFVLRALHPRPEGRGLSRKVQDNGTGRVDARHLWFSGWPARA